MAQENGSSFCETIFIGTRVNRETGEFWTEIKNVFKDGTVEYVVERCYNRQETRQYPPTSHSTLHIYPGTLLGQSLHNDGVDGNDS